jgi:hypothetical protein
MFREGIRGNINYTVAADAALVGQALHPRETTTSWQTSL